MSMAPKWLAKDARLADDEELRRLQLRWFADDIWMRRVAFWLIALVTLASALIMVLDPFPQASWFSLLGFASAPFGWFMGTRRPRQ
jgi:hypothetical protein